MAHSAFSSPLEHEERPGQFACAGCGAPLFDAAAKYDSGTGKARHNTCELCAQLASSGLTWAFLLCCRAGWPSFFQALPGAVAQTIQPLYCLGDFGARECRCARCDQPQDAGSGIDVVLLPA